MMKFFRKKLNKKIVITVIMFVFVFLFISNISASNADSIQNADISENGETKITESGEKVIKGPDPIMTGIVIVLGWIAFAFSYVIGGLATIIINALVWVAQFNKIIEVTTVTKGWVVVRDICNMFFILILLVIAFATILKVESYNAKKLLPKLFIMAILINFSKTICGLAIDFSQVIMLTFVNGFAVNAPGHFVELFQMQKYGFFGDEVKEASKVSGSALAVGAGIIMGLIAMMVSVVVILVLLAVLVMRIITLWVLTILSPIAFLAAAFPAGQKYTSRWWGDFSRELITGPMLAFFIWLALFSASTSSTELAKNSGKLDANGKIENFNEYNEVNSNNALFNTGNFQAYIITLALLIGGLMEVQKAGGFAADFAGKGMSAIQKGRGLAWGAAKLPLKGAKELASFGVDKIQQAGYGDLNLKRVWAGMKEKRAENRTLRYAEGQKASVDRAGNSGRFMGALAMSGAPGDAWNQIASRKGWRERLTGGKRMNANRERIEPELEQAKFEEGFVKKNLGDRRLAQSELRIKSEEVDANMVLSKDKITDLDTKIKAETDSGYKKELIKEREAESQKKEVLSKEKESLSNKIDFARNNRNKLFSDSDVFNYKKAAGEKEAEHGKNMPMYAYEARAAEQKAVNDKVSKIKDVTDGGELLRILSQAIREKDKSMIKAISKKMAGQGDENDFLGKEVGRSDFIGLQNFMKKLQDEVGFGEQEAKELGSDISQTAKTNKVWSVAGAYKMNNGKWEEQSKEEQAKFASEESKKEHVQANARTIGRKGYGFHDEKGDFHINSTGAMMLQQYDFEEGIQEVRKNMQRSAAQYLAQDKVGLENLVRANVISGELMQTILDRATKVDKISHEKFETSHAKIEEALKT